MKIKYIEFVLFFIFVILLVLGLTGFSFSLILEINIFSLVFLWIYGFIKRKRISGFTKSEFWERILCIPLMYGFMLTSLHLNYSNFLSVFGIIILIILFFIRGIQKLSKRDFLAGVEFFLVFFVFLGFLFRLMHYPGAGLIRSVFMTLLPIYYFAMGIIFVESIYKQEKTLSIFSVCLYGILGIYLCAILFDTMFWPGSMELFWSAAIFSLVVLPLFLFKFFKKNNLSENISLSLGKIIKRFVLVSGISLFFAVASPHQYLRFVYGNRPQLIEAYYNCYLLNTYQKFKEHCDEFQLLERINRAGLYYQGMSNEELNEVRMKFNN